ncbi:MAG: terminase small subunit [Gammaproteobacteria bacterium]
MTKKKLTPKQSRFIDEYMVDLNATQAAIRAGYSPRTANTAAAGYLAKLGIQQEVSRRVKALCSRYSVTHQNVLSELAAIAFSDIGDLGEVKDVTDDDGHTTREVVLHESRMWGEAARRSVQELKSTRSGPSVKCYSKLQALELLGRYLTLWRDDQPQKVVSFTINVNEAAPVVVLSEGNGDR